MWIQNVSLADVRRGDHRIPRNKSMLIQIVDPAMEFPTPKFDQFTEIHQFEFLDIEAHHHWGEDFKITSEQAQKLVDLLQHALANEMDVVVHCVAGVCRSGAVAEVGIMMGFNDTLAFRNPNLLVKHSMLKALGWYYDENEPHTINGVPFDYDLQNNIVFRGGSS